MQIIFQLYPVKGTMQAKINSCTPARRISRCYRTAVAGYILDFFYSNKGKISMSLVKIWSL